MALNNSSSLIELPTNLSHDHEWVINISRSLEETLLENNNDDDELTLATIFNVPNSLRSSKPVSYTPQMVSIGPYHHRRLEVVEMEQHKLAAARWVQKVLKNKHNKPMGFHELVARVAEHDIRIRSCYHRYLDFDREKLAWMFTIDVSFLYQYLRTCPSKTKLPSLENMGYLMEWARKKIWHNAVLRDIIMMENQVPLFLLKEIHGFLCEEEDDNNSDKLLASMLMGLCKRLAPIKHLNDKCFEEECFTRTHLLELLYYTVAPNWTTFPIEGNSKNQENNNNNHNHNNNNAKQVDENKMYGCMGLIFNFLWCVTCAPVHILVKIFKSNIILGLIKVPVKIVAYFLELRDKSGAVKKFVSSMHDVVEEAEKSSDHAEGSDESPLVEELAIPSVEELSKTGVVFRPTKGGINAVRFDKSSATLHLPVIHVTDSSDVVLRNLVAYEACIAPEGMILARYTELMNGIIDTEEDVKILRESGVLLNHLKSDKEVASLWNGMTTSVKVTKVPIVDKVIEDVNAYYSASWKVKVKHSMKKYVYASWPCLTFLAANILLFLSVVETVCTMYGCSKLVRV
ncbi:putative UPF0481 protein At3g02645 [Cajanus cajan]|uniref:UPF0481 protein At3g02645 family n=1 Tax=Cajanus cajan TaxID=3821 RepID=A0A151SW07_CAJCA|nr:putative UPF0481 protein At3g02645 [Cajanus cajan]KYP58968.1 Putative UPF0481 protein At3g02645 family [Cajanus cajan]